MTLDQSLNLINVAPDGTFRATGELHTTPAELDALFAHLRQQQHGHLVLFFHGGRVSEQAGLATANALVGLFEERIGAHAVFFLWESSEVEVIPASLGGIAQQPFFQELLKTTLKFVLSKLEPRATARATGRLTLMSNAAMKKQQVAEAANLTAFGDAQRAQLKPVSTSEALQFQQALKKNPRYQREVKRMARQLAAERARPRKRVAERAAGGGASHQLSAETATQVHASVKQAAAKPGLVTTEFFNLGAVRVFMNVVQRLREGTDHGVSTTIVEEVLREFYIGQAVTWVWNGMKQEAQSAFLNNQGLAGDSQHAGTYFLERLRDYVNDSRNPPLKVSLVGHSAGAIYICRLLEKAAEVLPDYRFHQIVFLAPGVDFDLFKLAVIDNPKRSDGFRVYNLRDQLEALDGIIPSVYPRSLLYFVSSLLEETLEKPLVGMERFYSGQPPYDGTTFRAVRDFVLGAEAKRAVWSETTGELAGLNCAAQHHGGFPFDPTLQDSLESLLRI